MKSIALKYPAIIYLSPVATNLNFYSHYLNCTTQINNRELHSSKWIRFNIICLAYFTLTHFCIPPCIEMSDFYHFLKADIVHFILPNQPIANYFLPAICCMNIYFYYRFYLKSDPKLNQIFSTLLFGDFRKFALGEKFGRYQVVDLIKRIPLQTINLLKPFMIGAQMIICGFHLFWWAETSEFSDRLFGFSWGYLNFAIHLFHILLLDYTIILCTHAPMLVSAFGMAGLVGLFIRVHQNLEKLRVVRKSFHWNRIHEFIRNDIQTFELIFLADKTFGPLFLAFIAVNGPLNAYLVMALSVGTQKWPLLVLGVGIAVQQFLCTVGQHLAIGYFTKRLYSSSLLLNSLLVRNQHRVGHFRCKLKLSLAIFRLHSKRRFGFTYGSFGLVTLKTFGKVEMIY